MMIVLVLLPPVAPGYLVPSLIAHEMYPICLATVRESSPEMWKRVSRQRCRSSFKPEGEVHGHSQYRSLAESFRVSLPLEARSR